MGVVEEPIEQRGDGGGVAEELPPVLDWAIGSNQRGRSFVAAHDDLEQILGRGVRQALHPEVVDDEERDGGDEAEIVFAGAGELGIRELIEEDVRLAVADAVALLDDGEADRLGEVALPGAGRT
jgi:hypothetical protein